MKKIIPYHFADDEEKMIDFKKLSRESLFSSYTSFLIATRESTTFAKPTKIGWRKVYRSPPSKIPLPRAIQSSTRQQMRMGSLLLRLASSIRPK